MFQPLKSARCSSANGVEWLMGVRAVMSGTSSAATTGRSYPAELATVLMAAQAAGLIVRRDRYAG